MPFIAYPNDVPGSVPGIETMTLEMWRPGEAAHETLTGGYKSVQRGRERFAGEIAWPVTSNDAEGQALEAWLEAMDDPANYSDVPLGRPTFAYTAGTNSSTVVGAPAGSGAILDREHPGFRRGCYVRHTRLRQILTMSTYAVLPGNADNVSVRFSPFAELENGDLITPATTIRIRKRSDAGAVQSPRVLEEWGPWTLPFVEDIVIP